MRCYCIKALAKSQQLYVYVEDKSLPETVYEGFDLNWTSPANQLNLRDLVVGAPDYIDERKEVIFSELMEIQSEIGLCLVHSK